MEWILTAILVVPFAVSVLSWWVPRRVAEALTLGSGVATFVLAWTLVGSTKPVNALGGWLRTDALSTVFLVAVAFLYALTAIFAIGYLRRSGDPSEDRRYSRRYYAGLNLFCWAMAVAPLVDNLALLWVAIEITTVVSALLVAIDDTEGATEAAWKYVIIASLGLGIALFATIIMYSAGTAALGNGYNFTYPVLLSAAAHLPSSVVRLADLLAVLGFGTKMGLFPVHTWLPDAHSEAPTPVSALLSGALLAVSFYAILRFFQITERALGPAFPRNVLLAFGLASLALAALYVIIQRDLKRLLAYSSVEHMGILAIGMSFSAVLAVVGVLLHVLAHAAAKGTAFFGAGSVLRKLRTKDMARIRGVIDVLPWTGPMLVLAVLALSAMPPFGIFRSEFLIVAGGLSSGSDWEAAILVGLVTLAFLGLSWYATRSMMTPVLDPSSLQGSAATRPAPPTRGETSWWMVSSMVLGLIALAILGIHPPEDLAHLLYRAALELGARR
ncbi:MAG: NADH dehydrogenase FAD-containing subunit [Actinobacteria bacterium]|nr:NADH dehydrogenase FAD-containing subunit [Actinomycetota bacterium]